MRRRFMDLVQSLSRHLRSGALQELTLTTNGVRLAEFAESLAAAGIRRVNVSLGHFGPLDLRPHHARRSFAGGARGHRRRTAGWIEGQDQHDGAEPRQCRGNPRHHSMAHSGGMDITLIETMPLGAVDEDRTDQFLSLTQVRHELESFWTLRTCQRRPGDRRGMFGCRKPAESWASSRP